MKIQPVKTAMVGCGSISDAYLSTMTQQIQDPRGGGLL